MHIKNILNEGELIEESTIKDSLIVQVEGEREVKRKLRIYNLDMVIAVGYRINSSISTIYQTFDGVELYP